MKMIRPFIVVVLLGASGASAFSDRSQTKKLSTPVLVNTCLVTRRFQQMVGFYQRVLGAAPHNLVSGVYAEFPTGRGVVAIFSSDAQEHYIPGSAEVASNKSAILEFRVVDVDAEFARLQDVVKTWVKRPSNTPWGNPLFLFS
jgi:uncharacterized glyoxalase superfamily protein PhnB